jgi:hypothetical protein
MVPAVRDQLRLLADLNPLPILYYVRQFPEGAAAMTAAPNLTAYYERHAARASFENTVPPPPPPRQAKPSWRPCGAPSVRLWQAAAHALYSAQSWSEVHYAERRQ